MTLTSVSLRLTSAPCLINNSTTSNRLFHAARISIVNVPGVRVFTSIPLVVVVALLVVVVVALLVVVVVVVVVVVALLVVLVVARFNSTLAISVYPS